MQPDWLWFYMKIAYVSDSTIGLTPQEAEQSGVYSIPQQVVVNGKSYRDYLEISPEQIMSAQQAGQRVSTSQPVPEDIEQMYRSLLEHHDRIVSVHVSSKLSGTFATASQVAAGFGGRVKVLDGLTLNGGLSFLIEEARDWLERGYPFEELDQAMAEWSKQIYGFVVPATLEHLHRGGRIGGLQALLGSLLKIVPILHIQHGVVQAKDRSRGFHKGLERVAQLLQQTYPEGTRVVLAHSGNLEGAAHLHSLIRSEGVVVQGIRHCGAAVSAHTGPGTVALFAARMSRVSPTRQVEGRGPTDKTHN
jgi:DegV family protein with EDD domain